MQPSGSTKHVESNHLVTCVLNRYPKRVTIPDAVLIQFVLLKMSIIVFEKRRGINKCIRIKNLCFELVKNTIIMVECTVNKT